MPIYLPPPRSILKATRRLNPCTDVDVDLLAVKRGAGVSSQTDWTAGTLTNTAVDVAGRVRVAESGSQMIFQSPGTVAGATSQKTLCDGTNDSTLWFDFWPDPSVFSPNGFILKSLAVVMHRGNIPYSTPLNTPIFQVRVTQFDDNWNREDLIDPFILYGRDLPSPSAGLATFDFRSLGRTVVIRPGTSLSRTGSGRDQSGNERFENITIENNKKVTHLLVNRGFSIGFVQLNNQFQPYFGCLPAGTAATFDVTKAWRCTEPIGKSMGPYSPETNGASALDTSKYPGYGYAETFFVPGPLGTSEDYGAKDTATLTGAKPNGKWGISLELHKPNINHVGSNIFDQPYHELKCVTYAPSGTIKVVLNMGAVPSNEVHFRADSSVPTGTSITYSIRGSNDNSTWSTAWSALDGDVWAVGSGRQYQYYEVTATLTATPDSSHSNTPVLTALFITERVRYMTWRYTRDFDAVSVVDPITGQSSIGELKLPAMKLGRGDARDLITQVTSGYPLANIEAWVYLRNVVSGERFFLNFYRLENREPVLGEEVLTFVSGLDRLKVNVPPQVQNLQYPTSDQSNASISSHTYNSGTKVLVITVVGTPFAGQDITGWRFHGVTGALAGIDFFITNSPAPTSNTFALVLENDGQEPANGDLFHLYSGKTTRQAVDYNGTDFASVYNDILSVQAQVPQRLIGNLPATTGRVAAGRLTSQGRPALDPLQEVALHCGGAIGWVRGRITYFDIYGTKTSVETWSEHDYYALTPAVGADRRMPSVDVKYDYDWVQGQFASEVIYNDGDALLGMGRANLFDIFNFPDELCKWNNSTEAPNLASKFLNAWSTGVRIWNVKLAIPRPWRELGDCVTVSTDQYTDRRLKFTAGGITDQGTPVKGRVSAVGVIVGKNLIGDEFSVAILGLNSVYPASSTGTITANLTVAAPTGVTVTSRADRQSLNVTWTDVTTPGVDTYHCQYRKNGDTAWIEGFKAAPGVRSIDIPGLTPGTAYDIQIRAGISQLNAWSAWVQVLNTTLTFKGFALPQGTVSVDANGVYSWTADLPVNALSCRFGTVIGTNTSGFPSDATVASTGTIINGTLAISQNAAGTLAFGQTIWITIVPFTATGGTGTQLPAIHIRGSYISYSASKTANYSPQSYIERTNPPFGTQNDGNDNLSLVGNLLSTQNQIVDLNLLVPGGTSGVTLTQIAWDVNYTNGLGTPLEVTASFFRKTLGGAVVSLASWDSATGPPSQTGWQTVTASLNENSLSRSYQLEVNRRGGSIGIDVGLVAITYTMGDPKQTL